MATRLNAAHDQRTRDKIKTSQLVNRLQRFALSDGSDPNLEMTKEQISAATKLLAKTLPDLSSVQITGEGGGPVQVAVSVSFDKPE